MLESYFEVEFAVKESISGECFLQKFDKSFYFNSCKPAYEKFFEIVNRWVDGVTTLDSISVILWHWENNEPHTILTGVLSAEQDGWYIY